ncbi:MAG: ComEC/Rec2 family competence protein [Bacteroidota bacterium]|nr:ComEC/Rec2 family competence protein [Bacteroidota bacterium]
MASTENIRQNPILRILFPFMLGIIFADAIDTSESLIPPVLILLITTILALIMAGKFITDFSFRWIPGIVILIAWFAVGFLLTSMKLNYAFSDKVEEKEKTYIAAISEEPVRGRNSYKIVVDIEAYRKNQKLVPVCEKVMLYIPVDAGSKKLHYGDRIIFSTGLQEIKLRGNPSEFDYAGYMKNKGIKRSAFVGNGNWQKIQGFEGYRLIRFALLIRQKLLANYKKHGLSGQELAIVSALTLGYKEELNEPTRKAFSDSGAMHILAVSGLHVGIIQLILNFILRFLDKRKKSKIAKAFIIIAVLWFYALITGLSPSVTRAAIMFTLIQIGISFRQDISIFNIVATTALVVLFFYPLLLFNLGFQYSYLALTGILFFHPKLYPLLKSRYWLVDKAWALVVASFSAQLALAPLSIFYFGQFPNYFLLTNLLVIPSAFLIIVVAVGMFIFSFFGWLATIFAFVLQNGVGFLLNCLVYIQEIPGSSSTGIYMSQYVLILWYVVIIFISLYFIRKNNKYFLASLSMVTIILGFSVYHQYKTVTTLRNTVFNLSKSTAVYVRKGNCAYMFCDSSMYNSSESKAFYFDRFISSEMIDSPVFINIDNLTKDKIDNMNIFVRQGFIEIDSIQIAIVSDDYYRNKTSTEKLLVDYVLLRNNASIRIKELLALFDFDEMLIDGSNPFWQTDKWQQECDNLNIPCFVLNDSGAKEF